jgi:hypothetical protein
MPGGRRGSAWLRYRWRWPAPAVSQETKVDGFGEFFARRMAVPVCKSRMTARGITMTADAPLEP